MPGYATEVRNGGLNALRDRIDGGAGAGTLKFYTGPRPSTGAAISTEVLLGTLTFSDPSAPDASSGVLTFSAISDDISADATGTAAWARAEDSAGNFAADFSVSATGGGGEITLNTTSIVAGGPISITSFTVTAGNA